MKRCIPPELRARADAAEKRLDDAVADLLAMCAGYLPGEDDFHHEIIQIIDADAANVIPLKRKDR